MNKDVIEITMCLFMNTNVDIWAVIFKSCLKRTRKRGCCVCLNLLNMLLPFQVSSCYRVDVKRSEIIRHISMEILLKHKHWESTVI